MMSDTLSKLPIKWAFFDAATPESYSELGCDEHSQLDRFGRKLTGGEIGCFKSHFEVLSAFESDQNLDWLLVIEDDVYVDVKFDFAGLAAYAERRNINYIRLYCRHWKSAKSIDWFGHRQVLRFKVDPHGTQAYLINRAGADAFRASISSIAMPIDGQYGQFWRHGLDIFAVFPFPVLEISVPSLIEDRSHLDWAASRRRLGFHLNKYRCALEKRFANLRFMLTARQSFS